MVNVENSDRGTGGWLVCLQKEVRVRVGAVVVQWVCVFVCVCVWGGWWGGGPGAGMFIEGGESRLWLLSGWIQLTGRGWQWMHIAQFHNYTFKNWEISSLSMYSTLCMDLIQLQPFYSVTHPLIIAEWGDSVQKG